MTEVDVRTLASLSLKRGEIIPPKTKMKLDRATAERLHQKGVVQIAGRSRLLVPAVKGGGRLIVPDSEEN